MVEKTMKENPDIAVVYTTHNETGTGVGNPIREIEQLRMHTMRFLLLIRLRHMQWFQSILKRTISIFVWHLHKRD